MGTAREKGDAVAEEVTDIKHTSKGGDRFWLLRKNYMLLLSAAARLL